MKKERQVEVMRRGEGAGRAGRGCLTAAAGMMMAGWQNPVYECMYVGSMLVMVSVALRDGPKLRPYSTAQRGGRGRDGRGRRAMRLPPSLPRPAPSSSSKVTDDALRAASGLLPLVL